MPELPPFDYTPMPYDGPSAEEILALRKEFVNPGIFHYYQKPVCIVEGKMQYLFDETGRRYLDGFGGIVTVSVGHAHPEVVKAANTQNETISHTTSIYLNPQLALYAKELAAKMPGGSEDMLFRELRLGGKRSGCADGTRLHWKLRSRRFAECLPRGECGDDGTHVTPYMEVQCASLIRHPACEDAGYLSRTLRGG